MARRSLRGLTHLSTACAKTLRAMRYLDKNIVMHHHRIETALERIEAAMARIDAAREVAGNGRVPASSARLVGLVNNHEKLREQVAETLRELDDLLTALEE